ncbi:MAG: tRNA pseudouridine(55) synthase TruB [Bacteroidia bacterium]|nr:tRNA pseudouridine(55) synthase TruB [Bacteroidia bacterium]
MTPANFDKDTILQGSVLLFDKPFTWSSFQLVKKIKYVSRAKKVGHAGTLDPLATGLLVICTGTQTKTISTIQDAEKEYTGTIVLGSSTPSFDLETEPDYTFDYFQITKDQVIAAALTLTGEINQAPPVYSAIKLSGVRAYEHARNGVAVEMKLRPVTVREFEITGFNLPEVHFRITCSKGTYIRSIASDLGKALNNGAHLSKLVRTRIGEFKLEDAFSVASFEALIKENNENIQEPS